MKYEYAVSIPLKQNEEVFFVVSVAVVFIARHAHLHAKEKCVSGAHNLTLWSSSRWLCAKIFCRERKNSSNVIYLKVQQISYGIYSWSEKSTKTYFEHDKNINVLIVDFDKNKTNAWSVDVFSLLAASSKCYRIVHIVYARFEISFECKMKHKNLIRSNECSPFAHFAVSSVTCGLIRLQSKKKVKTNELAHKAPAICNL